LAISAFSFSRRSVCRCSARAMPFVSSVILLASRRETSGRQSVHSNASGGAVHLLCSFSMNNVRLLACGKLDPKG